MYSVVEPAHTIPAPLMAAGSASTVTALIAVHPVPRVYVITEVPFATPDTIPVDVPTVAADVLLLLHVPPPASVNAVVEPAQTLAVPVIAEGRVLTVTTVVFWQPVASV